MYFSKSLVAMFATAALTIFACASCTKETTDNPQPEVPTKDYTFTAEVASFTADSVKVAFTAGENIRYVRYAYGSIFTYAEDVEAFKNGILPTIKTVVPSDSEFTVPSQDGESTIVYVRAIKDDSEYTDIITINAVTGPIAYQISNVSLGSFVYTCPENIEGYAGVGILAMAATTPDEWGMTAEEIVGMYADYYMIDCTLPSESAMVELNGEPNVDHILGIVYWKEDYTYEIKTVNITTAGIVANAPKSSIATKVENITSSSADLVFTPGENTCGYFYKLYKKADYEELLAAAVPLGKNPIYYVREIVAAGGSMNYLAQTDSRSGLSANTDYTFVCFPFNVNGTQGWGESQIIEFKTAAE